MNGKIEEKDYIVVNALLSFLFKTGNRAAGQMSHMRAFWDPDLNGGNGGEFLKRVMGVWVK